MSDDYPMTSKYEYDALTLIHSSTQLFCHLNQKKLHKCYIINTQIDCSWFDCPVTVLISDHKVFDCIKQIEPVHSEIQTNAAAMQS